MIKKLFLCFILMLSFASALEINPNVNSNNNINGVNIIPPTTTPFNNITGSVNHSSTTDYWIINEGTAGTFNGTQSNVIGGILTLDLSWLSTWGSNVWCALTGCTMTGDINMQGNDLIYGGADSSFNTSLLIDGDTANGNATLAIESESSGYACINLTEGNNVGIQICNDGDGLNQFVISNANTGYEYFEIDRITGLIHLHNNTEINGNVTADYFIGDGAELTNLNVDGVVNVTGDFTGYSINLSFLLGSNGIGGIDMRGDPWYFSGSDWQFAEDVDIDGSLNVDGNTTSTYYFGNGSQLTGITGDNSSWNQSHANTLYQTHNNGTFTNSIDVEGTYILRPKVTGNAFIIRTSNDVYDAMVFYSASRSGVFYLKLDGNTKIQMNANGHSYFNTPLGLAIGKTTGTSGYKLSVNGKTDLGGDVQLGGNILPNSNNTRDLGSITKWFNEAYIDTINAVSIIVNALTVNGLSIFNGLTTFNDDINQTNGNATINLIYGEMWSHNDTGFITIDMSGGNTWVNITINSTRTHAGEDNNGFTYNEIESSLTALVSGKYDCSYGMSTGNAGNNQEYQYSLVINNVLQNNTDSHRKIGASGDVGYSGGRGWLDLNIEDKVQLQARNNDGTVDLEIHAVSVNCLRIGNL